MALACTFRLAAPGAQLGFPEIKLGLIPGYGGTQRLPRLVGEARATELILTGRTVLAEEAERLAAPTARLGFPEIKLGLIPGYGGTQRLPRLVGEARATELILTGRTVLAEEAERIGLINHIVEGDLIEAGQTFAREMTGFSLPVLCLARDAIRRAHDLPLHDGLKIEADLSTLAFQTADAVEGMTAFIEKRKPVFGDG